MNSNKTTAANSDHVRRLAAFWRMLHITVTRYGSHPMGQLLIVYTMNILHENGYAPTVNDLCKATGLPKSSVSRYVAWQIRNNYVKEVIDPDDRRTRRLIQSKKGKDEMKFLIQDLDEMFAEVDQISERVTAGVAGDPQRILARMEELTAKMRLRP